jgi:hypothetical protein
MADLNTKTGAFPILAGALMTPSIQIPTTQSQNAVAKPEAPSSTVPGQSTIRLRVSTRIKAGNQVAIGKDG